MPRKHFHALVCFVRDHPKSVWQQQLANTYTLGTAGVLSIMTLALVVALVVARSPYAARTLPFFVAASLCGWLLLGLSRRGIVHFTGIYLVFLYLVLSFALVGSVGIGAGSMVLCAGAIIFAGTLCGYWCALVPAKVSTVFLLAYRAAELNDLVHPLYVMSEKPTNFATVIMLGKSVV